MEVVTRKRLSADDWTAAALSALADGGLAAVAVEPIAARLGTTKGSFYWHFTGRDALVAATLLHWERAETVDVIAATDAEPDVMARLRKLFTLALEDRPGTAAGARVELALQPTAGHPLVAPVLERVTQRRLGYLTTQFGELGFERTEARRRATIAYSAYLGHVQLMHATPDVVPDGAGVAGYVDAVLMTLTSSG